jgi:rhamnulokinase
LSLNKYHIAIDIGAGSGRAILGRIDDSGILEINEIHRFSTQSITVLGNRLVNIYQIFNEICKTLKLFANEYEEPLGSIGIETWSTDFGILDQAGKLIGLPFFYRDKRTEGTTNIVDLKLGREQLHLWTGGRFDPCSTLHQMVSMVRDDDIALKYGEYFLFLGDLLNYFLTGIVKSEYSVASYSQMYNMFENCWENRIFDAFNIPKKLQPKIVYPGETIGTIRNDILEQTDLSGYPVVIAPAVHDTASAALAVSSSEKSAFISSGTWSLVGMVMDHPIINQDSFRNQISSTGMGFGKVLIKKNIVGLWILQECQKSWKREGLDISHTLIDELAEIAPAHFAFIDSDDPVFFRPKNMVFAIQSYLKKTGQKPVSFKDVGQISRIIFESMALKYRQSIEMIELASGTKFEKISIVGGGSNIDLINRFTASVTNLPVYTGPDEASSIGNIMMQAYGMGEVSGEAKIKEIVKQSFSIKEYLPISDNKWSQAYQRYHRFCKENSLNNNVETGSR